MNVLIIKLGAAGDAVRTTTHLALGSDVRCVSLFTFTSPWEIHDYGLQRKIVSPLIKEFFYKRGFAERATNAINLADVTAAVLEQLEAVSKAQ